MSAALAFVIPAFNAQRTIGDTLRSVLHQTLREIEVVVVDDGSRDATAEIVRSFHDARVRLVRQRNSGLASARNSGLHEVESELVAFVDGDDTVEADYARIMSRAIGERDGVRCGWRFVGDDLSDLAWEHDALDQDIERLEEVNSIVVGSVVHRTAALRAIALDEAPARFRAGDGWAVERGVPRGALAHAGTCAALLRQGEGRALARVFDPALRAMEDWDMLLRLRSAGATWAPCVERVLFNYRLRPSSMSMDLALMHDAGLRVIGLHPCDGASCEGRRRRWTLRSLARAIAHERGEMIERWSREVGRLRASDLGVLGGALRIALGRADGVAPRDGPIERWRERVERFLRAASESVGGDDIEGIIEGVLLGAGLRGLSVDEVARDIARERRRVVIAGMGRNGRDLALRLTSAGAAFAWLDDALAARCPVDAQRIDRDNVRPGDWVVVTPEDGRGLLAGLALIKGIRVDTLTGLRRGACQDARRRETASAPEAPSSARWSSA